MLKTIILSAFLMTFSLTAACSSRTVYIATDGSENGAGTADSPLKTLQQARDFLRKYRKPGEKAVVCLKGGTYRLEQQCGHRTSHFKLRYIRLRRRRGSSEWRRQKNTYFWKQQHRKLRYIPCQPLGQNLQGTDKSLRLRK